MIRRDLAKRQRKEESLNKMNINDYFRRIPKVDMVLKEEAVQALCGTYGRGFVVGCIREELDRLRALVSGGAAEEIEYALEHFIEELPMRIQEKSSCSLKKVYNATGIILHTNLGRAPLGKVQMDAMMQAACGYSNLEYLLSHDIQKSF